MFIVKDCTRNPPYTMVSNDAKNVRDIVIGITGDEMVGDHVLLHLGHMTFGQFLVWGQLFIIKCVPDEDVQALGGDDPMGMTDNQYKGMLLDQLEDWQEVLDLAIKAGNTEIQEKVEKQIRKINEKLKF